MNNAKIFVITPVRNEERFVEHVLQSVVAQSVLPARWVIVDDGSTDSTAAIVNSYCRQYPWLELLQLKTSDEIRAGGSKVVKAFNYGYDLIKKEPFDFIVKLDGDLTLPHNYFERMLAEFSEYPRLGICGGTIFNKYSDTEIREERAESFHVRGALKMIRRECWEDINGFKEIWNWDGFDIIEARFLGWETKSIDIPVIHHRPTSAAYDQVAHAYKSGYESYKMGSDWFLTIIRSIVRLKRKPYLKTAFAFFSGYKKAYEIKEQKIVSRELARFSNKMHYSRFNIFRKKTH